MARIVGWLLIDLQLILLFTFSVVAGACIQDTLEQHRANTVMVNLMGHSLKELGEIQTREI